MGWRVVAVGLMERGNGRRRRGGGGSKLCISVNMQLLTLINLPFSSLGGCVWEGGSEGGCGGRLLSYMRTAVHQLIVGRGKRASLQSSPWSRRVSPSYIISRDEGWWEGRGVGGGGDGGEASNVCMMSKKGIKMKEGIMAEICLCSTTGERSK